MLQNRSKKRQAKKPQTNKLVHKKRASFPSEKIVSRHLAECVKDNLLNLLKQIHILNVHRKSQVVENVDEDRNKIKDEGQNKVKKGKQRKTNKMSFENKNRYRIFFIPAQKEIIAQSARITKSKYFDSF